jgi:hypothetical protein
MTWLASVPVLVAYALGLLVIAIILAWVAYVMAEIARAARPEAWATAREGLAFGQDLARRLPRGRDLPRRLLARFTHDGVSRTGSVAGQLDPPRPGATVLYVGPGYWTYITAWVIDAHPDGALDVEWVHPFLGVPVRALGVRPEHDRAAGVAYWRSHPASTSHPYAFPPPSAIERPTARAGPWNAATSTVHPP